MIAAIRYWNRCGFSSFAYVYGPQLAAIACVLSMAAVTAIAFLAAYI